MSYKGLPEHLVARINPLEARAYAVASGWRRDPNVNGKVAVFTHPGSDLDQVLIPLDPSLSDYARRMAEAVVNLAAREGRPAADVLDDLLLPPSDVLRFRLDEPGTRSGDVALDQGIGLFAGVRKALLAAACSVVQPRPFHPRLSRAEAEQLLQACRLGQTERGSFTAVVACPLDAVGPEPLRAESLPLFAGKLDEAPSRPQDAAPSPAAPVPFTRQATSLLMRSVSRIASAVDADRVPSLLGPASEEPVLSANLCEALLMMQPSGDGSRLSVLATWSRTLPPPPGATPPSAVHLRREYFPIVENLAVTLRPSRAPKSSLFVGLVDSLHGDPDETGRVSGDVQLLIINQEELIKARVSLGPDDYHTAWEAHGVAGYVSLQGILLMGERTHRIIDVSNFRSLRDGSG